MYFPVEDLSKDVFRLFIHSCSALEICFEIDC